MQADLTSPRHREGLGDLPNPLGLTGIEFIEFATASPQVLGQSLQRLGFQPVARHRSREVTLYRQGDLNVIVNAHRGPQDPPPPARAEIAAVAFRVRDAAQAYRRVLERGAWPVATHVEVMELNIPAIHGPGHSRLYFVDRVGEFSIYDVDFLPIPGAERQPPATAGLRMFGVVQYIGFDRMADWCAFYGELFGFTPLPEGRHFGVLTEGCILASPCGTLHWQLIEPAPDALDLDTEELLNRVAFGCPDIEAAVATLSARGVEFIPAAAQAERPLRGALTVPSDTGPCFELVRVAGAPA